MFTLAKKVNILTRGSMTIDSLLEMASSGHSGNCSFRHLFLQAWRLLKQNRCDMNSNDKRSHLVYVVFFSLYVSVFSNRVTPGQQFLLQLFYFRSLRMTLWCIHWSVCAYFCHCPKRAKRDPNALVCDAKYSSQPRVQVSNGYWRLMAAHSCFCVYVCVLSLSKQNHITSNTQK